LSLKGLRVLFVVPARSGYTGASIAALNIALGLAKLGVQVHVATTRPPSKHLGLLKRLREAGVHLHVGSFNPPGALYWAYLAYLAFRELASLRPRVVHPHLPKVAAIVLPMSILFRAARVMTVEGDPVHEAFGASLHRRLLLRALWELSQRLAQALLPCSSWLAEVLKRRSPGLEGKLYPTPNPIDYERFSSADGSRLRRKLGLDGPVVFTAARLDKVKGVDLLIEAAAKLLRRGLKASFLVAGEGPSRRELEDLALKLGVADRFFLLGFREDVEELTAACDIAVLPSRYEPFGMPAAEAGACGKPVVVSATGGLREVVVDGVTGLFFRPNDADDLARALAELLMDPELRRRMGEAGRLRVSKLFTPEAVARRVLKVYFSKAAVMPR